MTSLDDLLSGGIYGVFLILCRIGGAFSFMPGFGDTYVTPDKRLFLSLGISFVLLPVLSPLLPAMPESPAGFARLIAQEVITGVFIGLLARFLLAALDLAGFIIATETGLSAATAYNPQMSTAGPIVTTFLTMSALALLFVTNLHHMLIEAIVGSYQLFKPGSDLMVMDMSQSLIQMVGQVFIIGIQMAAPFILLGTVFNLGLGLLARLMPQMQVFMVAMPLQIIFGLLIFGLVLSTMLQVWLTNFSNTYFGFFQ